MNVGCQEVWTLVFSACLMGEARAVEDFKTGKCSSDRLPVHKAAAPFRTSVYRLSTRKALGQMDSFQDPCLCPLQLGVQAFLRPQRPAVGGAGGRQSSAANLRCLRLPVLSVDPRDPTLCPRAGLQQNRSWSQGGRRARTAPVSRDAGRPRDRWRWR